MVAKKYLFILTEYHIVYYKLHEYNCETAYEHNLLFRNLCLNTA